jgi:hypothetical protein
MLSRRTFFRMTGLSALSALGSRCLGGVKSKAIDIQQFNSEYKIKSGKLYFGDYHKLKAGDMDSLSFAPFVNATVAMKCTKDKHGKISAFSQKITFEKVIGAKQLLDALKSPESCVGFMADEEGDYLRWLLMFTVEKATCPFSHSEPENIFGLTLSRDLRVLTDNVLLVEEEDAKGDRYLTHYSVTTTQITSYPSAIKA